MSNLPSIGVTTDEETGKIPVGISACLLGKPVRYNGGHSQSRLCLGELSDHFHYRSFCPELEAGFGVPRPTLRLSGDPDDPRMLFSTDPGRDVTDRFRAAVAPVVATPLALLNHYVRRFGSQYLQGQRYLEPYPPRLGLTNQL